MANNANDKQNGIYVDIDAIRAGAVSIATNNAVTTQAGWTAFIDGRSDAQMLTLLRGFFKTLIKFD
jgi:hypothetical protein